MLFALPLMQLANYANTGTFSPYYLVPGPTWRIAFDSLRMLLNC